MSKRPSWIRDAVPDDYERPCCQTCGAQMTFLHSRGHGSRYWCVPCEMPNLVDLIHCPEPFDKATCGLSEASWIIRHMDQGRA